MTPEQKAKELIEKFKSFDVTIFGCIERANPCIISNPMFENSAKECALIVVNEIIPIVESVKEVGEYWQKVKTIIESSQKL